MQATIQRSFAGGELAPALHARADQVKYVTGLRTCRNFFVRREGGVTFRGGTGFIRACKTTSATVQILPYLSEVAGESLLIENGNGYLRFYKNGALVVLGSAPPAWNSATAYVIGDLVSFSGVNYYARINNTNQQPDLVPTAWYPMPAGNILELPWPGGGNLPDWHQNGRVLTLTHPAVAPYELEFIALTTWILRQIVTQPSIAGPTGLSFTPGGTGTRTFAYAVTAVAAETYEESLVGSSTSQANVAEPTDAAPHVLTWTAVAGAVEYYVYGDPYGNGVLGFLGSATGTSFRDTGFVPDFAVTPPLARQPFANTSDFPAVSTSYQQRRFFARSTREPDAIYGSRVGFRANFAISSPLQDDDAVTFKLSGRQHHPVRHLLGLKTLLALTDGGAWTIGQEKVPLTPSTIPADQDTYVGASSVRPIVIGRIVVHVHARGRIVYALRFEQEATGLAGQDLTVFASHLFRRPTTIKRMDFAQDPHSIVWCVRSDGVLLGLTYIPEHDVWGWHRHDTKENTTTGKFEDVCVVPEANGDAVYVIVQRTIGGAVQRFIERLEDAQVEAATFDDDVFFVDSGLSYSGAAATVFTGLDHLNGQVVAVVGDGDVIYNGDPAGTSAKSFRVSGGQITLATAKSKVHIGLRYSGQLETLDLDVQGASLRDKKKRIGALEVLLESSSRVLHAGPDAANLRQFTREAFEPAGDLFSGKVLLNLTSYFSEEGRVLIEQRDPLPLTVLGILPQVELGG